MKHNFFASMTVCIMVISCQEKPKKYPEIEKAQVLLGIWENLTQEGFFTEKWIQENDSTLSAKSYFINQQDTLFAETMRLEARMNKVVCVVNTSNKENEKPVSFQLTSSSNGLFVFENPKHDFPKKITYQIITKDSLFAEISGDGKSQGFPFRKVK